VPVVLAVLPKRSDAYSQNLGKLHVGASLLAMDVNDNAGCLNNRVAWAFFASRLAPTGLFYSL